MKIVSSFAYGFDVLTRSTGATGARQEENDTYGWHAGLLNYYMKCALAYLIIELNLVVVFPYDTTEK